MYALTPLFVFIVILGCGAGARSRLTSWKGHFYLSKDSSLGKRSALLLVNQLDVRGINEAVIAHIRAVVGPVGTLTAVASRNHEIGPVDHAVPVQIPQEQTH